MSLRVWIWLVSLSVLWGGSFFFAKVAVAELRPLTVVFGRVALAAFALNLSLRLTGQSLFRRETPWAAFMIMGLLNNMIAFSLIFWGPDPDRLGAGLDPERHDATLHPRRRAPGNA